MQTSKVPFVPTASVWECMRAKEVFAHFLRRYASCPNMRREQIIACALIKVWKTGRLYQQAEDAAGSPKESAHLYNSIVRGGAGL